MARPRNPQRTADLRAATAESVRRLGIAGTTLRPLAAELGVAPRTLLYHFGSKENLLVGALRELRREQLHLAPLLDEVPRRDADPVRAVIDAVERLWGEAKQATARPFLALHFELTSLAIRDPERYRPLLIEVDRDWVDAITDHLMRFGVVGDDAHAIADALLIGYRGAVSFGLATGRWDAADDSISTLIETTRSKITVTVQGGRQPADS